MDFVKADYLKSEASKAELLQSHSMPPATFFKETLAQVSRQSGASVSWCRQDSSTSMDSFATSSTMLPTDYYASSLGDLAEEEEEPVTASSVLKGQTTVMMKNVPNKYTQRKLLREVMSCGFQSSLDFFYLPMDPRQSRSRTSSNRGFSFVNLGSAKHAERFFNTFHGKMLRCSDPEKPSCVIEIAPADIQGFEANAEHYLSAKTMRRSRDFFSQAMFLRPLPLHLQQIYRASKAKLEDAQHDPSPVPAGEIQDFDASPQMPSRMLAASSFCHMQSASVQQAAPGLSLPASNHPMMLPPQFCHMCGTNWIAHGLFCANCGASGFRGQYPGVQAHNTEIFHTLGL
ncbi:unnamed protein product [Polarella glacialis]|uniref:Mei2-like C-terminal RNA recognition motif domain-containing protein n=1 Tax=Polarella glacialis TaxID=89957 RepID=A0A813KL16_POLGL|nr:unnamed protein product [Polarella glacialis]|eukprot:CAMPEP_0115091574 /NCGR_PEP_ID=MMETSP0227-20121206/26197_1 /TAXON_ID=89957 /ORGANISM="Polarella glacialis, Strain CCMP 1383" /LENGTH=343 /DNA_ID=CAMNT_0002483119 /DNA_START=78 /DNA_END=1109 /DNA_ORIENTATION=+